MGSICGYFLVWIRICLCIQNNVILNCLIDRRLHHTGLLLLSVVMTSIDHVVI
ncbi:hypothetical protein KC19_12G124800 [Ceratodon purpureus]|uniref:Uncharacterized protein n=1 Tax=Ceratodon purpureus TaxID=3225 RepID=A0A8T0GA47_CERPU|nr:hypothetical protein KC19_12G124800 [Ceratodon purpureus]